MRRLVLVISVCAALFAAFASAGSASKPVRGPFAGPPPTTFPAGMVCPFSVYAEAVENRQTETVFSDGTVLVTGFFLTLVRNVETGKELTLVSQGSVRIDPEDGNLRVTIDGPIIVFFFPGDAGPGDASVGRSYFFHGRTSFLVDTTTFLISSFDHSGKATDLCAALSS